MIEGPAEARLRVEALREAGARLAARPVRQVVSTLVEACSRWADPEDPDRRAGVDALAAHFEVPAVAIEPILDAAFPRWGESALLGWIESELGSPEVLDGFASIGGADRRARGPRLMVALAARGVPTTPVGDLLSGLLLKAPTWVKPATGADDLVARYAATLRTIDPEVGEAVETTGWRSGREEIGETVLSRADAVVATGGEETMAAMRGSVDPETRLVLHGPRLSAAIVCEEALERDRERVLAALADDVAFAGQLGCLSPVVAYFEAPVAVVNEVAEPLRSECEKRWPAPSRRRSPTRERSAWAEWTALAAVEAAAGTAGTIAGGADRAWTVQARVRASAPDPPPVPRALVIAPVESATEAVGLCTRRRGLLAAVGVAGAADRIADLAPKLAAAGVERICPLGRMQRPPLAWRRDGRTTLAELVRWVDLETGEY